MISLNNFLKNTLYLYLSQGLIFLLPFFILPFLLKTLSIESFGLYNFSLAFSQFLILLIDFGFNLSITKKIAENVNKNNYIKNIFWTIIFIKISLLIISILVSVIVFMLIPSLESFKYAMICGSLMLIGNTFYPVWWFQGLNKFKILTLINISSKAICYPFIFILVTSEGDYMEAVLIQSLSFVLASVFSFVYLFLTCRDYFFNINFDFVKKNFYKEIKDSYLIFLSNSSISLYTNTTVLILGVFSSPYSVGIFSAIERIVRVICTAVLVPFTQSSYPFLIRMKSQNIVVAKKIFRKMLTFIFLLSLIVMGSYFFLKDLIIKYFFQEYEKNILLLDLFMFSIFPVTLGGVLGQLGLLALGDSKEKKIFSNIYIYVGLLTLPINFFMIIFFNENGALLSVFLIETILFFLMFYFVLKTNMLSR